MEEAKDDGEKEMMMIKKHQLENWTELCLVLAGAGDSNSGFDCGREKLKNVHEKKTQFPTQRAFSLKSSVIGKCGSFFCDCIHSNWRNALKPNN